MGWVQDVRVMATISTRNTLRESSRFRNAGGHGMLYAVLADAMICSGATRTGERAAEIAMAANYARRGDRTCSNKKYKKMQKCRNIHSTRRTHTAPIHSKQPRTAHTIQCRANHHNSILR